MMMYNIICSHAGVMELADVVDSKSTAGDSVPVRVRPPAPNENPFTKVDGFLFVLFTIHFSSFIIH